MLEKLRIEFTKSRANHCQDNALVEGKNGAVIRKLIGYGHIAGEHAEDLQKFYTAHLNPYLNFHRPCGFATVSQDARGKRLRKYKVDDYATPYEKLKALPEAAAYLKENMSWARLDQQASHMSDTECAKKMGAAKTNLLRKVKDRITDTAAIPLKTSATTKEHRPGAPRQQQAQIKTFLRWQTKTPAGPQQASPWSASRTQPLTERNPRRTVPYLSKSYDHLVLELKPHFMIILQLFNWKMLEMRARLATGGSAPQPAFRRRR
jgi:hypothetical protein